MKVHFQRMFYADLPTGSMRFKPKHNPHVVADELLKVLPSDTKILDGDYAGLTAGEARDPKIAAAAREKLAAQAAEAAERAKREAAEAVARAKASEAKTAEAAAKAAADADAAKKKAVL